MSPHWKFNVGASRSRHSMEKDEFRNPRTVFSDLPMGAFRTKAGLASSKYTEESFHLK